MPWLIKWIFFSFLVASAIMYVIGYNVITSTIVADSALADVSAVIHDHNQFGEENVKR